MVSNHRKKSSRHRGSWTHGHGEKKKHRGAGSRGGRGNAGSGKRGDAKKPSYWKIKNFHKGKKGFKNPTSSNISTITLSQLNTSIQKLTVDGLATKKGDIYSINLDAMKITKLLGTGVALFAFDIIVSSATEGAIKKVEAAGGKVNIISKEKTDDEAKTSKSVESKE